jgi:hypothetical protein
MAIILTRSCRLEKRKKKEKETWKKGGMSSIIHDRWWGCVLSLCNNRPQSIRSDPFQTTCWLIVNRITRLEGENSIRSCLYYSGTATSSGISCPFFFVVSLRLHYSEFRIEMKVFSSLIYFLLNIIFISTCVVSLRALYCATNGWRNFSFQKCNYVAPMLRWILNRRERGTVSKCVRCW